MNAVAETPRSSPMPPPPGGLPLAVFRATETDKLEAADYVARHWRSPLTGPLVPGSAAHRQAVAKMFQETFNPYRPSIIDWPQLSADELERLTGLPIWDIAVQTEGKASQNMQSYADTITDPDWKLCIDQNAWEERRHKVVLHDMVRQYGIVLDTEPPYPKPADPEWAYLVTGYSECIDSFFAFGLYLMAQRSGLFPAPLVEVFEPVMQEECRHILLFANWVAAHRSSLSLFQRIRFELRVARVYLFLARERMGMAKDLEAGGEASQGGGTGVGTGSGADGGAGAGRTAAQPGPRPQDNNFTLTGSKAVTDQEIKVADLLRLCLEENDRRFAGYDERLLRPTTIPWLVRIALKFMR